jgi:hypothetical protein
MFGINKKLKNIDSHLGLLYSIQFQLTVLEWKMDNNPKFKVGDMIQSTLTDSILQIYDITISNDLDCIREHKFYFVYHVIINGVPFPLTEKEIL